MMDYLQQAEMHYDLAHSDGTRIEAQLAIAAVLIAIAKSLDAIHEIMEWSDDNERRLEELRASAD